MILKQENFFFFNKAFLSLWGSTHLSLGCGSSEFAQEVLVGGIRGILQQLLEQVAAGGGGDVQVVIEGSAVGRGTGERVHLARILCSKHKHFHTAFLRRGFVNKKSGWVR